MTTAVESEFCPRILETTPPEDQFLEANAERVSRLAGSFRTHETAGNLDEVSGYLRQFRRIDWMELALILLEHVDYFSRGRFGRIFEEFLSELTGELARKAVFAVLGGPEDSSSALSYYCSKAYKGIGNGRFMSLVDVIRTRRPNEAVVFFVDDNLGSGGNATRIFEGWLGLAKGRTVAELNNEEKAWLRSADLRYFVLVDFVDEGHERLPKFLSDYGLQIRIHPAKATQEREGCFKETAGIFHQAAQREAARKMAGSIGYELLSDEQLPDERRELFALGYGGSQKLIVFEWNTPTCTLPILWKSGIWQGRPWVPLFPRH